MIFKISKANLFLLTTIFLALSFYVYYFYENRGSIKIENNTIINQNDNIDTNLGVTKFKDVLYKTSDEKNREYITKGKEAYFYKNKPNIIHLDIVHSFAVLKDNTILNIKSDKAEYNKNNKNIKYTGNITITNKKGIITADTANFYANKNRIKLENNVIFKDDNNIIQGDIAVLNTLTNNLSISMNNKSKKVYGKRKQY